MQESTEDVIRRLAKLESHIINMIIPMQSISRALTDKNHFLLLIDKLDHSIKFTIERLDRAAGDFNKNILNIDIASAVGEIKYLGNRLNEIEKTLNNISKDGIPRKVSVDFTVDGINLVKKPKSYDENEPLALTENDLIISLLDTLTEREKVIMIHRFGLLGESKKSLENTGKIVSKTVEHIRQCEAKAIRKLRKPTVFEQVRKITTPGLRKAILGEK